MGLFKGLGQLGAGQIRRASLNLDRWTVGRTAPNLSAELASSASEVFLLAPFPAIPTPLAPQPTVSFELIAFPAGKPVLHVQVGTFKSSTKHPLIP